MKNIFFLLWFKLIRYLERCLHLHISTGNVPIASVLPRTPQRQVVAQVEPQVIRHGPEDVRHHPGIIFVLFDWCPKEDLASSAVPSNWERLAFISSPIRVIRFSSAPFYKSYILYFFNQISTYLNSHLRVEESRDISFYLEKFCKCFPETFSNFAFSKSLSLPAELLVNRPPSVGLVEETLLSTVPENLMKSYLTLTHKDIEGT